MGVNLRLFAVALVAVLAACSAKSPTSMLPTTAVNDAVPGAGARTDAKGTIVSSVAAFGLVLGFPKAWVQPVEVAEAGYTGKFTATAGPNVKVSCQPKSCKPALKGTNVTINVSPTKHGTGTLTISDSKGNHLALPYRVSNITMYSGLSDVFEGYASCLDATGNLWVETYGRPAYGSPTGDYVSETKGGSLLHQYTTPVHAEGSFIYPSCALAPDNAIWFPDGYSNIGRVATTGGTKGQVTDYPIPGVNNADPTSIVLGPDNNLWFTEQAGYIGRMTTKGAITQKAVSGQPSAIVVGPDKALWFTGTQIGRITTKGAVKTYPFAQVGSSVVVPSDLVVGADGNFWYAGFDGSHNFYICMMTVQGKSTCNAAPELTGRQVLSVALGPDKAVWFTFSVVGIPSPGEEAGLLRVGAKGVQMTYLFPPGVNSGNDYYAQYVVHVTKALWLTQPFQNGLAKFRP